MESITLPIYNTEGKEAGEVKLNTVVFDGTINTPSLYQAVNSYRANQRNGLAATKTRGEVSGGGRKPWKQKGTGRARVGSTRSPLWRHGGVIFGPHPRDFSFSVPDKIKALALKSSLNAKVKEKSFTVLDSFKVAEPKTKEALKLLKNLKLKPLKGKDNYHVLLLLNEIGDNLKLALRNIDYIKFSLAKDTHAYEVLSAAKIVITKDALEALVKRLK